VVSSPVFAVQDLLGSRPQRSPASVGPVLPPSICASWRVRTIPGGPSWPPSSASWAGEKRPRRRRSSR